MSLQNKTEKECHLLKDYEQPNESDGKEGLPPHH
jgi:drug/metabolite transporter (DMT)-like permease